MYKHLLVITLLCPSLALANSDPCKVMETTLDQVKTAHKNNATLTKVLPLVGQYKGIVKQSWQWLEKGDDQYNVWRIGQKAGCESLNQGAYYYAR
ncbi:hypothetical protein TW85_22985 [Marinomonas sp. S3726]|uniref:hypothetical protein n=1 Tax=Marinomonas sp. S3726 TaxID=579484 RepID=UPI0005FA315E|nr:hypothetical protein [Marinomonas sp. S3726]KJZ08903.1 hypothetical protein TW85_22985 [Marinomonas sp. S3726]